MFSSDNHNVFFWGFKDNLEIPQDHELQYTSDSFGYIPISISISITISIMYKVKKNLNR